MRASAPSFAWQAPQLHVAAPPPTSAMRALRVCVARAHSTKHDARFNSAIADRTGMSRVVTSLRPAPRGRALAASAGKAGNTVKEAFFDRTEELNSLAKRLNGIPNTVLLLTGPPSSGKSVLLKQLVACSKQSPHPSVIDCRAGDYTNPEAFAVNLVMCMQNDWKLDDKWFWNLFPSPTKVTGSVMGAELKLEFLKAEVKKDPHSALQVIKDAYLKLVRDAKQKHTEGKPWPVIIIDEANLLRGWSDESSLTSLLAFFVYLTKQEHLAHVILATSDTFLTHWLESGPIKSPFRSPCVVGNLDREQAHTFFVNFVLPSNTHPPGADKAWQRVYEVCGGNPGLLFKCAGEAAAYDCWVKGCDAVVRGAMKDISKGLRLVTLKGAAWSTEDFRAVLHSIVSSPHAAVSVEKLDALLGEGGAAKLESMNEKNMLVLRTYDPLACDIDADAFGPDKDDDVYTLPSAAHVLAARRKLKL